MGHGTPTGIEPTDYDGDDDDPYISYCNLTWECTIHKN